MVQEGGEGSGGRIDSGGAILTPYFLLLTPIAFLGLTKESMVLLIPYLL